MDDIRGKQTKRHHMQLRRGADGRLRSAGEDADIGDLWAQQQRNRLAEAIEEDKKKAARDRLRKERGFVGIATNELSKISSKLTTSLFGERATKKPPTKQVSRTNSPAVQPQVRPAETKLVEINIAMPSLPNASKAFRWLNPPVWSRSAKRSLSKLNRKKSLLVAGGAVLIAMLVSGVYNFYSNKKAVYQNVSQNSVQSTADSGSRLQQGTPNYTTLLPAGKSVSELGGWYKVSPPGKSPVYAYVDKIDGASIDVTEQPLPANFQANTAVKISQLAQGYGDTQKLDLHGGKNAYVGTSNDGTQSLITSDDNLLILIKASSPLTVNQWSGYVGSLQ